MTPLVFIHVRDALRLLTRELFQKESLLRTVHEVYYIPRGHPTVDPAHQVPP